MLIFLDQELFPEIMRKSRHFPMIFLLRYVKLINFSQGQINKQTGLLKKAPSLETENELQATTNNLFENFEWNVTAWF
jgi:hypothetical protein